MIYDTLNDAVTLQGGVDTLLAGRFRIIRQLGQGGMGSVWLAEDTQLDGKLFAIKMLPSILVSNKRAYCQLKDEALVSMKLTHPNIVTLRAFEENDGNPFLVMDYIDGDTLDDCLGEWGTLAEGQVVTLLTPIASALDYAHSQGVVHRDVKPGNVMVRADGVPFILDFGIAREMQETMTRVTGKLSSGTLLYMSPEQLNGAAPKPAQDVYSFAAMAYECLTGHPPFHRGQVEYQIVNAMPERLAGGRVSASVMAGLSKRPEDRPATCMATLSGATGAASRPEAGRRAETGAHNSAQTAAKQPAKSLPDGSGRARMSLAAIVLIGVIGGVWYANWKESARIAAAEQRMAAERKAAEEAEEERIASERHRAEEKRKAEEDARRVEAERMELARRKAEEDARLKREEEEASLAKDAASEIRIEAKVQKGKVDRLSGENGFRRKMEVADDLFTRAEALYAEGKWRDAAIVFSNHVAKCKELVALDDRRQEAIQSRKKAQTAFHEAESKGAKSYALDLWNAAVKDWQKAKGEFASMDFAVAKSSFETARMKFTESGQEAIKAKQRQEQAEAEKQRIAEQKRIEAERLAAVQRAEEERRMQAERRKAMQSLPGKWICSNMFKEPGWNSSYPMRHEYDFRDNGTYTYIKDTDSTKQTFTGQWVLSGNILKLQRDQYANVFSKWNQELRNFEVHFYGRPIKYIVNWRDDGTFELRCDVEDEIQWYKDSGCTDVQFHYDANGTYTLRFKRNKLFMSGEYERTETAQIYRRHFN